MTAIIAVVKREASESVLARANPRPRPARPAAPGVTHGGDARPPTLETDVAGAVNNKVKVTGSNSRDAHTPVNASSQLAGITGPRAWASVRDRRRSLPVGPRALPPALEKVTTTGGRPSANKHGHASLRLPLHPRDAPVTMRYSRRPRPSRRPLHASDDLRALITTQWALCPSERRRAPQTTGQEPTPPARVHDFPAHTTPKEEPKESTRPLLTFPFPFLHDLTESASTTTRQTPPCPGGVQGGPNAAPAPRSLLPRHRTAYRPLGGKQAPRAAHTTGAKHSCANNFHNFCQGILRFPSPLSIKQVSPLLSPRKSRAPPPPPSPPIPRPRAPPSFPSWPVLSPSDNEGEGQRRLSPHARVGPPPSASHHFSPRHERQDPASGAPVHSREAGQRSLPLQVIAGLPPAAVLPASLIFMLSFPYPVYLPSSPHLSPIFATGYTAHFRLSGSISGASPETEGRLTERLGCHPEEASLSGYVAAPSRRLPSLSSSIPLLSLLISPSLHLPRCLLIRPSSPLPSLFSLSFPSPSIPFPSFLSPLSSLRSFLSASPPSLSLFFLFFSSPPSPSPFLLFLLSSFASPFFLFLFLSLSFLFSPLFLLLSPPVFSPILTSLALSVFINPLCPHLFSSVFTPPLSPLLLASLPFPPPLQPPHLTHQKPLHPLSSFPSHHTLPSLPSPPPPHLIKTLPFPPSSLLLPTYQPSLPRPLLPLPPPPPNLITPLPSPSSPPQPPSRPRPQSVLPPPLPSACLPSLPRQPSK
ncbi:hypothetical protein C7M84_017145 [Penaeus vannamei]|uniref:Uncharacterized protein n=1 Tax=Penaeus vannamei TaxID=6689 RepID=A0A423SL78_PENVA|nr:hypothetical protein C7M84_017145 [Penaeus vannamei]